VAEDIVMAESCLVQGSQPGANEVIAASMTATLSVDTNDLIARIANGDRAAFRSIYASAGPKLFAIALRMLRQREEAEEVLQEAFVRIWERSHQFDPAKGAGSAWLATIARHCALDRLRKPGRNAVTFDEAVVGEIDAHVARLQAGDGEALDLKRCLVAMRRDYRDAVVLAYVHGMTHEELASQLGKPVGTIKSWVRRGLDQLKDCMTQ
jgi:RNA polymerase sigma-70 factor, ECF subfamily